jgi:hypothetical protein
METRTVKLHKPLPNMLRQVIPMFVVVPKLSQGEMDLGDSPKKFSCLILYMYHALVPRAFCLPLLVPQLLESIV